MIRSLISEIHSDAWRKTGFFDLEMYFRCESILQDFLIIVSTAEITRVMEFFGSNRGLHMAYTKAGM